MRRFLRTFTWKIAWRAFLLIVFFTVADVCLLIFFLWNANLRADQMLRWGLAEEVKQFLIQLPEDRRDFLSYKEALRVVTVAAPGAGIFILDEQGNVRAALDTQSVVRRTRIDPAPLEHFLAVERDAKTLPILADDPASADASGIFSVTRLNELGGTGYLYVTLPSFLRNQAFRITAVRDGVALLLLSFVVLGVFDLVFAFIIFNRVTRRFQNLTEFVKHFREGARTSRVAVQVDGKSDEVEELGIAFNEMAASIDGYIGQLEQKDKLRRELIANISHDLRGPTTLILGATELAATSTECSGGARTSKYLQVIGENAGALKRLLTELYELAEFETAEVTPESTFFSPGELLSDIIVRYSSAAEKGGVHLRTTVDDDAPIVFGDPMLIERAVSNLLENAIRHTPSGGSVTVSAESAAGGRVKITVADDGPGISEEDIPRIFERNYQSSHEPENVGASGLGLAIVRKIIQAHGSTIAVERLLPKGTRFTFLLPVTP